MPKRTLLDVTQSVLSSLDSDEVNSITDTVEATQVAMAVRDCLYEILAELDLSSQGELMNLESVSDLTRPALLRIPDGVSRVEWVNYTKTVPDA